MEILKLQREATVDDLYEVANKAEIINGEILLMAPTGFLPNRAALAIVLSLSRYEREIGGGFTITDNAAFAVDLPHRKSFSPDAAWYTGPPTGGRFMEGGPPFAAEVRREGSYGPRAERELQAKRADYFSAGTLVVWDVDVLREEEIRAYGAGTPESPRIFRRGEVADAEPALPGWRFPVDELFE